MKNIRYIGLLPLLVYKLGKIFLEEKGKIIDSSFFISEYIYNTLINLKRQKDELKKLYLSVFHLVFQYQKLCE